MSWRTARGAVAVLSSGFDEGMAEAETPERKMVTARRSFIMRALEMRS